MILSNFHISFSETSHFNLFLNIILKILKKEIDLQNSQTGSVLFTSTFITNQRGGFSKNLLFDICCIQETSYFSTPSERGETGKPIQRNIT